MYKINIKNHLNSFNFQINTKSKKIIITKKDITIKLDYYQNPYIFYNTDTNTFYIKIKKLEELETKLKDLENYLNNKKKLKQKKINN